MERRRYEAIAQRDGDSWLLRVPMVERSTQALRLDKAEEMARDLIAVMTGAPADSFDVEVTTRLEPDLSAHLSRVAQAKVEAAERQREASALQREAVRKLTESGLTVRDTGRLLGLTYQRVAQLRAERRTADR